MLAQQPQPQAPTTAAMISLHGSIVVDGHRRRGRLLMGVPEVTPLLGFSSSSSSSPVSSDVNVYSPCCLPVVGHNWGYWKPGRTTLSLMAAAASIFRSFLPTIQSLMIPTCRPVAMIQASSGRSRKVITGTFFGPKRGRVCFAVQEDPRSEPVLLLDLAIPTSHLVKEMASGMVRILLECERSGGAARRRLLREEPRWTVYCNGQKRGYAVSRPCGEAESHVLSAVQAVSVGAGVLPVASPAMPALQALERKESMKGDGRLVGGGGSEVMYMRARFERVVGGKDSEAFYMINPDCGRGSSSYNNGAPELSIFLLRK